MKEKDTLAVINLLIESSLLHAHNVNYEKAYDGYWEALLLADHSKNLYAKAKIYQELGWLYSFYKRNNEALKYFTLALNTKKEFIKNKSINIDYLTENYFSLFIELTKTTKK